MPSTTPAPAERPTPAVGRPTAQPVVRRSMGTWRSLIISMAVLGLLVAGWLALVPRVERVEQPAVDVAATTAQVSRDTGTPLWVADGGDWKATSVRVEDPRDGVRVLHAGYHLGPDRQQYISVTQTLAPTTDTAARAWVGELFRAAGGSERVRGANWATATQLKPSRNALIRPARGNPHVVVVGTVSHAELAAFANSLRLAGAAQVGSGSLPGSSPPPPAAAG